MSQPIEVYDTKTGEKVMLYSPKWVEEQVAAGAYSYEPVTVEKPTAKRGRKTKASEPDNTGASA